MENHMRTCRTLFLLAVVALTACGGGGGGGGPKVASLEDGAHRKEASTTSTTLDPQAAMLRYAKCMRGQGIDFPDPDADGQVDFRPGPGEQAAGRAAEEACKDVRPTGRELTDKEETELYDNLLALAKCLRQAGFDAPDPTLDASNGVQFLLPGGGTGDNPELEQAVADCRAKNGDEDGPSGLFGG
jgi:hypothetical protein